MLRNGVCKAEPHVRHAIINILPRPSVGQLARGFASVPGAGRGRGRGTQASTQPPEGKSVAAGEDAMEVLPLNGLPKAHVQESFVGAGGGGLSGGRGTSLASYGLSQPQQLTRYEAPGTVLRSDSPSDVRPIVPVASTPPSEQLHPPMSATSKVESRAPQITDMNQGVGWGQGSSSRKEGSSSVGVLTHPKEGGPAIASTVRSNTQEQAAPVLPPAHDGAQKVALRAPPRALSPAAYSKMLLAYEKAGRDSDAIRVYGQMRSLGLVGDPSILSAAVRAYARVGNARLAEQVFGDLRAAQASQAAAVDESSYNTMIEMYANEGEIDKMEAMVEELSKAGSVKPESPIPVSPLLPTPSPVTPQSTISAAASVVDQEDSEDFSDVGVRDVLEGEGNELGAEAASSLRLESSLRDEIRHRMHQRAKGLLQSSEGIFDDPVEEAAAEGVSSKPQTSITQISTPPPPSAPSHGAEIPPRTYPPQPSDRPAALSGFLRQNAARDAPGSGYQPTENERRPSAALTQVFSAPSGRGSGFVSRQSTEKIGAGALGRGAALDLGSVSPSSIPPHSPSTMVPSSPSSIGVPDVDMPPSQRHAGVSRGSRLSPPRTVDQTRRGPAGQWPVSVKEIRESTNVDEALNTRRTGAAFSKWDEAKSGAAFTGRGSEGDLLDGGKVQRFLSRDGRGRGAIQDPAQGTIGAPPSPLVAAREESEIEDASQEEGTGVIDELSFVAEEEAREKRIRSMLVRGGMGRGKAGKVSPDGDQARPYRKPSPRRGMAPWTQEEVAEAVGRAMDIMEEGQVRDRGRSRRMSLDSFPLNLTAPQQRARGMPARARPAGGRQQRSSTVRRRAPRAPREAKQSILTAAEQEALVAEHEHAQEVNRQFRQRHGFFLTKFEPEWEMEDFETNPDIDEKGPVPLMDYMLEAKKSLTDLGLISEEEWETSLKEALDKTLELEQLVTRYAGPPVLTAVQEMRQLSLEADQLPPSVPPHALAFTKRALLSLQSNPSWPFQKKQQMLSSIVKDMADSGRFF